MTPDTATPTAAPSPEPSLSAEAKGDSVQRVVRHRLIVERAQMMKWGRRPVWAQTDARDLEDWEWRLLLQLSWMSAEMRQAIAKAVAEAAAGSLLAGVEIAEEIRTMAIKAIVERAAKDSMPNSEVTHGKSHP